MATLDAFFWFAISRLKGVFARDAGKDHRFTATGFWVFTPDQRHIFITNRHNVDPTLKLGESTSFHLAELHLERRLKAEDGTPSKTTDFHRVVNLTDCLWISGDADCAILVDPILDCEGANVLGMVFNERVLATAEHLATLSVETVATFVGFPGNAGKAWHDQAWNLPIARTSTIASLPAFPYTNESVKTADVTLVTGLSFSGSSGSPVFNEETGFAPGGDIHDPSYRPAKIVGIMSGHYFGDPSQEPEMFRHSGLSYFTRATAIRALIERARSAGFKR